jgi:hypothetical protein
MVFFRRTTPDAPDPWLTAKVVVFTLGAALALVGMATGTDWLVGAAAVVLVAGVALRFASSRKTGDDA